METMTGHVCLDDTSPLLRAGWLSCREQQYLYVDIFHLVHKILNRSVQLLSNHDAKIKTLNGYPA